MTMNHDQGSKDDSDCSGTLQAKSKSFTDKQVNDAITQLQKLLLRHQAEITRLNSIIYRAQNSIGASMGPEGSQDPMEALEAVEAILEGRTQ